MHKLPIYVNICYDIFFEDALYIGNAVAVFLLLDDHWYHDYQVHKTHFRQSKLVALAIQKPVISVSSNGITGFILPQHGTLVMMQNEIGFISKKIDINHVKTSNHLAVITNLINYLAMAIFLIYPLEVIIRKYLNDSTNRL